MEKRTLTISDSAGTLVTAYEYFNNINDVILNSLENWDTFTNIKYDTAQKLVGAGTYILGVSVGEREITAKLSKNGGIMDFKSIFVSRMINKTPLILERKYYNDSTLFRREVLSDCYISGIALEKTGDNGILTLTILNVEPEKTIYLNGSTTPEEGKEL